VARTKLVAVGIGSATLAALAGVWLAFAAAGASRPPGKSGGSPVRVLDLAVAEYPGRSTGRVAERFASTVDRLSDGSMRVEVAYWPTRLPPSTPSGAVEAAAVRAVRGNRVELALLPSYALTAHGASTLQALQAPFALTSTAEAARATASPFSDRLQAGLADVGLTGLGFIPDGELHAFGFLKALTTPADFAGVTIRAPSSPAIRAALQALGAHPVDLAVHDVDTAVFGGFANDAQSLPNATDEFPGNIFTAAGLALFPKVDTLVASQAFLGGLRPAQRDVMRRAAAETRADTIAAADDLGDAEAFCKAGGTIVAAPRGALPGLRARVATLVNEMRRDPVTRSLLASFAALPRLRDSLPVRCEPEPPQIQSTSDNHQYSQAEVDSLFPPPGTYRRSFTVDALRAAGADETDVRRNAALTTLTFYGKGWDERFVFEWREPVRRPPCRGQVWLVHRQIQLRWNPATPCGGLVRLSWRRAPHEDIVVTRVDPHSEPAWIRSAYLGTWKRVDCPIGCGARDKLSVAEAIELAKRQKPPGTRLVSCHHVLDSKWDYECSYWHLERRGGGNLVANTFGIDVDESGIIRRGPP
jgi:TRAP-type C4-dicarboxylate transport system substrate-binding protein